MLKASLPSFRDFLFRAILLATLLNLAVAFSTWVPKRVNAEQQKNSSNEQAPHNDREGWLQRFLGDPIAVFNFFLVIFNGGLVYVSLRLVESTNKLWEAGENQRLLAEDTAKRQLRAYVGIQGGVIIIRSEGEQLLVDATVNLENWGQTPAYQFRTSIFIEVHTSGTVPFTDSGPLPLGERAHSIIGPRSLTETGRACHVSADDLTNIRTGVKTIFVWGRVDYADCFKTPRCFLYRCAASGQEQMRFSTSGKAVGPGWPLAPHALGYEAN